MKENVANSFLSFSLDWSTSVFPSDLTLCARRSPYQLPWPCQGGPCLARGRALDFRPWSLRLVETWAHRTVRTYFPWGWQVKSSQNAQMMLESPLESAMWCKSHNGTRHRETRSSNKRKTRHACIVEAHEPTRKRAWETQQKDSADHNTDKRCISLSHYDLVHKPKGTKRGKDSSFCYVDGQLPPRELGDGTKVLKIQQSCCTPSWRGDGRLWLICCFHGKTQCGEENRGASINQHSLEVMDKVSALLTRKSQCQTCRSRTVNILRRSSWKSWWRVRRSTLTKEGFCSNLFFWLGSLSDWPIARCVRRRDGARAEARIRREFLFIGVERSLGVCFVGRLVCRRWQQGVRERWELRYELGPCFACLLVGWLMRLGRPCNAWLTTLWRLATAAPTAAQNVCGVMDESGEVHRSIFSTTFRNVWVTKAWTRQCLRFQRHWSMGLATMLSKWWTWTWWSSRSWKMLSSTRKRWSSSFSSFWRTVNVNALLWHGSNGWGCQVPFQPFEDEG